MFSAPKSTSLSHDRKILCAATILFLICAVTASAQDGPLSLRTTLSNALEAHPRQVVSLALTVANQGPGSRTLVLEPVLPEGWKALYQETPFVLGPSSSGVHVVSFLLPSQALAGSYSLTYRVRDPEDPSAVASCRFALVVLPEFSLELRLLESPSFVVAGREYAATFVLTNTGNVRTPVKVDVESDSLLPYEVQGVDQNGETVVDVGEATEVTVVVRTNALLNRSMVHSLQVSARFQPVQPTLPPPQSLVRASSSVEVIPFTIDRGTLLHTLPVVSETTAETRYDRYTTTSLEQEFKAQGSLDEAGEHRIAFDLRKRLDPDAGPLFNTLDRYSVQYDSRFGGIAVGDLPYSVSPLLADNEFGRGAQATVNLFPWRIGTLYYKDVWSASGVQGLGGTIDFTVPRATRWADPLYRVGLNAFSSLGDTTLLGIYQQYSPSPTTRMTLDTALQEDRSGTSVPAVFAKVDGDLDFLSESATFIRAWPGFQGTYSDMQTIQTTSRVRLLSRALTLSGGFSLSNTNLLPDPTQPSAEARQVFVGADGEIAGWGTKLQVGGENWRRTGGLPSARYGTNENALWAGFRQPILLTTFGLGTRVGVEQNEMGDGSSLNQEYTTSLDFQPNSFFRDTLSARYNAREDSTGQASYLAGWGMNVILGKGDVQLDSMVNGSYFFTKAGSSELLTSLGSKLTLAFPWGHTLAVQGNRWFSDQPGTTAAGLLTMTYSVPFDLPTGRIPGTSVVTGRVFDAATKAPLPGVVLRLEGFAAVTDQGGNFTFSLPDPGTKYLQVDTGTVGARMVPAKPMPLEISAPGGGTVWVDIGMVEGSEISGTVALYGFPGPSGAFVPSDRVGPGQPTAGDQQRLGGLGNALVELSDGTGVWRKLTRPSGDFSFPGLRPGKYTLRVLNSAVPAYHTVVPESFSWELPPGTTKTVEFRVVQEQRIIKILENEVSVLIETTRR